VKFLSMPFFSQSFHIYIHMSIIKDCRDLFRESNLLLHQNFKQSVGGQYLLLEKLLLKRYQDKLVVVSDETDRKKASNETFRNKSKLKAAGFTWSGAWNSWVIDQSQLQHAQEVLSGINKTPLEKFIDKVEQLPEFIMATDNLSRKEELAQEVEKFVTELSTAVDAVATSAMLKKFFEFYSRFHGYSWHNTLLIYLQKPDANRVAGFKQWQEKWHRRVKQGAKGITILAPISVKRKEEPTTQPAIGGMTPDDSEAEQEKDVRFTRFMAVTVFDISDTEAMDAEGEIPEAPLAHGSSEPNEKAEEFFLCAVEMAEDMGIKVDQEKLAIGAGVSMGDHINISSDIHGVYKAAVVIHEIAHELLHKKQTSLFYVGGEKEGFELDRDLKELQAESVAYVVIRHYGFPAEHQATYVALYKGNKEAVIQNLSIIKKAADFIIGELDKIQKEHLTKGSQTPPTA
jgi:hypothetical protein